MFCNKTKEFLSRNNISFSERNIAENETALEELKELGYMTTPVTVVNGHIIIGFDEVKLRSTLGI